MSNDRAAFDLRPAARALSLAAALPLTGALFAFPFLLGRTLTPAAHAWLVVLLLGLSGAWGHALGYVPERRAWRLLLGPAFSWSLIVLAVGMIAMSRGTGA
jgi:predicted membrane protein